MNQGQLVFAQLMQHLPLTTFRRCVARYQGERKIKSFSCLDQFLCMAFAQLTYRESLRDIEACLRAQQSKLYHLGIRSAVARNTLANANGVRDWRIHADFAQSLIGIARRLYIDEPFGVDLKESVYALDTTTIILRFGRRRVGSDRVDDDDIANLQVFACDLNQCSIVETGVHPHRNQLAITKQPYLCTPSGCV